MKGPMLLIRGGRLVDPSCGIEGSMDLLIRQGKVAQIGKRLKADDAEVLEATGKIVTPGFIDLHVHLRTPGQEYKETLATGCRAAIKGGFTTICTMANTDPPVDSRALVEYLRGQSEKLMLANLLPYGAVTQGLKGEMLTPMLELKTAGAVGFSDDGLPILNAGVMRRALEYTRLTNLPIVSHCEDTDLSHGGVVHGGITALRLGLPGIPQESETVMIARDLILAEATGGRLHIAHVSTAGGVQLIRQAKEKGVRVTAEVTPHHLTLTEEAVSTYDSRFKMKPPVRTQRDLEVLREGLNDGTLDCVATDHAPHSLAEKEQDLTQAPFGVVGLETAVGVLLTELFHPGPIPLSTLIAALTSRPAKVLGIDRGTLKVGSIADVTILDPLAQWTVEANAFESKGTSSPFLGWRLKGQVTDVIVSGKLLLRNREWTNGESAS